MNLHKYMFSKKNMAAFLKRDVIKNHVGKDEAPLQTEMENDMFIEPIYKDTLFWCFYILKYGILEYELVANNDYKYRMREIERIINKLEDNKFKTYLINCRQISLKNFIRLCEIEKINIFIEMKYFFSELSFNDGDKNILKCEDGKYRLLMKCPDKEVIDLQRKCRVSNIEKPIMAISRYKAS